MHGLGSTALVLERIITLIGALIPKESNYSHNTPTLTRVYYPEVLRPSDRRERSNEDTHNQGLRDLPIWGSYTTESIFLYLLTGYQP